MIILEDQVDTARDEGSKLESSLNNFKQKYAQALNEVEHLENTVKTLQERLGDSRNKEIEKDQRIDSLKNDLESLDRMYNDTKHEVKKCEDVIEQLTQELNVSQEDLSMSQNRVRECEENIKNLKERVHSLTEEVGGILNCFPRSYKFPLVKLKCTKCFPHLIGSSSGVVVKFGYTFSTDKLWYLIFNTF